MTAITTKTGRVLTDDDIQALADEAERGYDVHPVHTLSVIDHTGDTKTLWNPGVQTEIDVAKETFNKLKKKGYLAYKVGRGGEKDEIMHQFDPGAGAIIMTPPLAGG